MKLPSRFFNVISESEDVVVYHMQLAYNALADQIADHIIDIKNHPNDSQLKIDLQKLLDVHNNTMWWLAKSIEAIFPGICEEEINEEIKQLMSESDALLERAEEIDKRLTSLRF